MRLIDEDALVFEYGGLARINPSDGYAIAKYFADQVKAMPTVDAVPVIRCKDCALWNDTDSEHLVGYCTEGDGEKITFRNEWCCWAERKEE